jgi:hypothetical protein
MNSPFFSSDRALLGGVRCIELKKVARLTKIAYFFDSKPLG